MQTRHCDHPSHRKEDTPQTAIAEVVAWKYLPRTVNGQVAYKSVDVCESHVWFYAKRFWEDELSERIDIRGLMTQHKCDVCYDYVICGQCVCTGARRYPRHA